MRDSCCQCYAKDMIVIERPTWMNLQGGLVNHTADQTKNAWDQSKVPGGSSSGSAACRFSQVRLVVLGSDTGGSIRHQTIVGLNQLMVSRFGLIAW